MKKLLLTIAALLYATAAQAEGTCTVSHDYALIGAFQPQEITFLCTADADDNSYPQDTATATIRGYVEFYEVEFGGTAPAGATDIEVVTSSSGGDILGGQLADGGLTDGEMGSPFNGTAYMPVPVNGTLTIKPTSNTTASAVFTLILYVTPRI